jgi:two-component system response regulator AtoC
MTLNPEPHTGPRILVADDEMSLRTVLAAILRREGFRVSSVKTGQEALEVLHNSFSHDEDDFFDLLIADIAMPQMDGMELLERVSTEFPNLPVVMLTAHGTVDHAVTALKKGAFDFLTKPYERDEIIMVVRKAILQKGGGSRTSQLVSASLHSLFVGQSTCIQHVREVIAKVANSPTTVLVTGDSGTGKELVAHALHHESSRRDGPFIRVNCAAIPESLIESEFFGFEKGTFPGATSSRPGRFELANEGTLFLDEIGDLPFEMQGKLLRVLQDGLVERVGGVKTIKIDVRLIASTNHNLSEAIKRGAFREDLFYRLNVVPIHMPPLRDRLDDIAPLVQSFITKFNAKLGRNVAEFTPEAIEFMKSYSWPGNVRELENIVERTMLFTNNTHITNADLPPEIAACVDMEQHSSGLLDIDPNVSMKDIIRRATMGMERDLIIKALNETRGNVTQAALRLKISRKSLQMKMKEHSLREDDSPAVEASA